jgi:MFS family permease
VLFLTEDGRLLFLTRFTRLFAYGALAVVLVFYVTQLGLTDSQAGLLLTCTLLGDMVISLWLTTRADRFGRRRTLIIGALLMAGAGLAFASVKSAWALMIAGTIGVISPSGNEVGPFLAIEQAALSHVVTDQARTRVFAWYTLTGAFATALGSLAGGLLSQAGPSMAPSLDSSRRVIWMYAALGLVLMFLFTRLSPSAEVATTGDASSSRSLFGVTHSRNVVARLSALFALDSFGGGFVVQSFVAYWFHLRFHTEPAILGTIFFAANLLAGISALLASRLAAKIGLVKTMVYTHLPSNILLLCVPLMPNLASAIALLWARFSISQMDVPTRQSYTMAIVRPDERSAVAGITGVARTSGAALAPTFAGMLFNAGLINWPFFLAGTLKLAYDLLLYRAFVSVRPPEEESEG